MQRLSGTDALFLSTEVPGWHQHVGGVALVDPTGCDRFDFRAVRDRTNERIARVPKFRWKLKEVPFRLDRAVWVEDEDFDIDRHLHRIAVPTPGGRQELGELVGMLMSHQLDRHRPLWEMWYIEGVVGGQVAVFTKYHHSLMDGVSGAGLAEQLLDIEPDPPPDPPPSEGRDARPGVPSDLELLVRAIVPTLETPGKVLAYAVRVLQRGVTVLQRRSSTPLLMGAPGPCWNEGAVGPRRATAFTAVSLEDVKALKNELGVKVNDVLLALVAGALRAHMLRHGDMATGPLVAGVPLSTRLDHDGADGNKVAIMSASLATDVEDPIERVRAIHASTQSAKELTQAIRARSIPSVGEVAPPLLVNLASRAAWAANIAQRLPVIQNVLVSNVPGPPFPLYMCGARVSGIYAASVLMMNQGLNITLMSYTDRVDFGVTADPELIADLWEIADGLEDALAELMEAADLGKPTRVDSPFDGT